MIANTYLGRITNPVSSLTFFGHNISIVIHIVTFFASSFPTSEGMDKGGEKQNSKSGEMIVNETRQTERV